MFFLQAIKGRKISKEHKKKLDGETIHMYGHCKLKFANEFFMSSYQSSQYKGIAT